LDTPSNKLLAIALLGMNEHEAARLELFLGHYWPSNCVLANERFADFFIINLDSQEGKNQLPQLLARQPKRPIVALSVRDTEINDVTVLRKPLSVDTLNRIIDSHLRTMTEKTPLPVTQEEAPASDVTPKPPLKPAPRSQQDKPILITQLVKTNIRRRSLPTLATQARIIRGSSNLTENPEPSILSWGDSFFYNPSTHLQQILKTNISQSRQSGLPVRLRFSEEKYIVLLPESDTAITNLSDNMLRARCLLPISQLQIRTDHLDATDVHRIKYGIDIPQDIDFLLWKVSLWSARGRLPIGTDSDSPITLKQWPNLTRLLAIPEFLRISALWVKTPVSLRKTIEVLNIETRYVCAFYSACFALELTDIVSANDEQSVMQNHANQPSAPKGLLRRILQRLRVA
jgi:hypothetical protein